LIFLYRGIKIVTATPPHPPQANRVKPEEISLTACRHIQTYLRQNDRRLLSKNDLNAILRLSQHLRVFGLLSATGYINQSNEQQGEVRQRTVPVWSSLLGQLIDENNPPDRQQLMRTIREIAEDNPSQYMTYWRKALVFANHWNFWARAYAGDD
jgi:hypothetical protein